MLQPTMHEWHLRVYHKFHTSFEAKIGFGDLLIAAEANFWGGEESGYVDWKFVG